MDAPIISSRQNPVVRAAAELAKSGERRRAEGRFLCEGARLCQDAALSGAEIETCFFTERARQRYAGYLEPVVKAAAGAYLVEDHVAALLSSTKTPQGVFCVCRRRKTSPEEALPDSSCVVLENLQDPGNLGTVLRTAEAFGVSTVCLLGDCCDPLSPKVLRASMGAVFRLRLPEERSPRALCSRLAERGFLLHAAVPDASARRVTEMNFSRGLHAVFIGNEGNGLTPETAALCHDRVTIPMAGRAESLNASAAATVLLWELCRGAGKKGVGR